MMRAAVLRGVRDLVVEDRPVPRAGAGEVLVQVDVDRLVTGHFPLDRTEDALAAGKLDPRSVKAVINPAS